MDITSEINRLDERIRRSQSMVEYIHTGPIIRKEGTFIIFDIIPKGIRI